MAGICRIAATDGNGTTPAGVETRSSLRSCRPRSSPARRTVSGISRPSGKVKPVFVEEWGFEVHVRTLTGEDLKQVIAEGEKKHDDDVYLLAFTLCDEDGNRLFSLDEVEQLRQKSWTAISVLLLASKHLNNLTEERVEGLKKTLDEIASS